MSGLQLVAPLKELWSVPARGGIGAPVLAGDGLVFTRDDESRIVALDADSGTRVWTYPWWAQPLAVADGVLVASATRDEMHLIDPATGRGAGCYPAAHPDAVIVEAGTVLAFRTGSLYPPGSATSTDLATGRRHWTFTFPGGWEQDAPTRLATSADALIIGLGDGRLVALDRASGGLRWQRSWPEWGWQDGETHRPARFRNLFVHQAIVLAEVGDHAVGLSLDDGRSLWEKEGPAQFLYGDVVYATTVTEYIARNVKTGRGPRSPRAAGAPRALGALSITAVGLVSETHAFLRSTEGALVAVERTSGKYAWHHKPAGGFDTMGPVCVAGRAYYTNGRKLYCLAPA